MGTGQRHVVRRTAGPAAHNLDISLILPRATTQDIARAYQPSAYTSFMGTGQRPVVLYLPLKNLNLLDFVPCLDLVNHVKTLYYFSENRMPTIEMRCIFTVMADKKL